jgi:excisionase family DNA binding protein
MNGKELMTVFDAAELLDVSAYTVRKLAREGIIPAFKMGSQWRFSRPGLVRFVEERGLDHARQVSERNREG